MNAGKYAIITILFLIASVVSVQAVKLFLTERELGRQLQASKEKIEALGKENGDLQAQIEYLSHGNNLEKELRTKFNYRKPDEKLMIVTP